MLFRSVEAGETTRVAGLAATPVCVTPSDQVTLHGPAPLRAAWIVVLCPWQIVAAPATVAVGARLEQQARETSPRHAREEQIVRLSLIDRLKAALAA